MSGKIYTQFISSFFMGAISGAFLYLTVFAPSYESDIKTPEVKVTEGVVIEGQMYGGCSELDSCATFRFLENRGYDYLPYPDAEIEHGKLPSMTTEALFSALSVDTLLRTEVPHENSECESYVDGLDFAYTVTKEEVTYSLDTCKTKLALDEGTQSLFIDVWNFMQNPTTTYPAILEEGVGEYIIEKTFERFHEGGNTENNE